MNCTVSFLEHGCTVLLAVPVPVQKFPITLDLQIHPQYPLKATGVLCIDLLVVEVLYMYLEILHERIQTGPGLRIVTAVGSYVVQRVALRDTTARRRQGWQGPCV